MANRKQTQWHFLETPCLIMSSQNSSYFIFSYLIFYFYFCFVIFSHVCIILCVYSLDSFFIYIVRPSECVNEWMGLGNCICYLFSSLGLFHSGFNLFYSDGFNFLLLLLISALCCFLLFFYWEAERGGSGGRRVWEELERLKKKTRKPWSGYSTWKKSYLQ